MGTVVEAYATLPLELPLLPATTYQKSRDLRGDT
jgi:hypothetical protein